MEDKMLTNFDHLTFRKSLIDWFQTNKRDLPWRKTNDPYKIWISEIMLQQTKVDTVINYYNKFVKRYPTIFHLAEADEQEVLKEWEGLGYYSRARNLHSAVKEVVTAYNGEVPSNPVELSKLKGVGPYTLGAIMSIAFQKPEPAVDGNVMRVLSRVLLIKDNISLQKTRRLFEDIVRRLICTTNPSSFNEGLMELGALICTPRSPKCSLCPVQSVCRAYDAGVQEQLPVKLKAKKQKTISYASLLIFNEYGEIAIEQRPKEGLLANMWQFPMIEINKTNTTPLPVQFQSKYNLQIEIDKKLGDLRHIFSHLIWDLRFYSANAQANNERKNDLIFVTKEQLENYPLSVAHQKIKEHIK